MKKLILIVLIMCFVVSISIVALAEIKFGNWDRWDQQLPPAENQSWYWATSTNEPRELLLKGWGNDGSDIILLFSDVYFYGDKKGKTKVSLLFYSIGDVDKDKKDWDIPNASLAIAAFPPKKGRIVIRTYKMEKEVLKFCEEWEIPFKNHEVVVLEDVQFRKEFEMWLQSQISSDERILPKHIKDK